MENAAEKTENKTGGDLTKELMVTTGLSEREALCVYVGAAKTLAMAGVPELIGLELIAALFSHLTKDGKENLLAILEEGTALIKSGIN